jgi:hypothetical protein
VVSVEADGRQVQVIIAGEGDLPPFEDLLSNLRGRAGEMTVDLKVVPERNLEGQTGS